MERDPCRKATGSVGDTLARLLELPHCRNVSAETPRTCCGTAYALERMGIDASTIVHDILRAGECHRKVAHFPIPTGNLSPMVMGTIQGGHTAIHLGLPESVSGFQDSVAPSFKKFRDLLRLISIDAHFTQRFAKVRKEPVEMPVV